MLRGLLLHPPPVDKEEEERIANPKDLEAKAIIFLALAVSEDRAVEDLAKIAGCAKNSVKSYRTEWRQKTPEEKWTALRKALSHCAIVLCPSGGK